MIHLARMVLRATLLLSAVPAAGHAVEPAFGPFAAPSAPVTSELRTESAHAVRSPPVPSAARGFLTPLLGIYQATLSSFDGPRCLHRPTCSRYAVEAVARRGVVGVGLAMDRLWRGARSSPFRLLPYVVQGESVRFLDPVEANDFWLGPP